MNKKIFGLLFLMALVQSIHQGNKANTNCDSNKNQYYDQVEKRCRNCPPGSPKYNTQYKMCECCPNNMIWDQSYKNCICPKDKPIHNEKLNICKACPAGLEFDPKENQCYHCPEGFMRGVNHQCIPMYLD